MLRTVLAVSLLIGGCNDGGAMAMANNATQSDQSAAAAQCNAEANPHSPMGHEQRMFPDPKDHEKLVIYRAIRCRDVDQVKQLLDGGLDPNATLKGAGLANWAATAGSVPILKLLIERGAKIDGEEGSFAPGPLDGAISQGIFIHDWSAYEFLLAQGADPEIRSGNPTLTIAGHLAMVGQFGKIDELLDRGYDRNLVELRHWVATKLEVSQKKNREAGKRLLKRLDAMIAKETKAK